jgi:hypothetical protein
VTLWILGVGGMGSFPLVQLPEKHCDNPISNAAPPAFQFPLVQLPEKHCDCGQPPPNYSRVLQPRSRGSPFLTHFPPPKPSQPSPEFYQNHYVAELSEFARTSLTKKLGFLADRSSKTLAQKTSASQAIALNWRNPIPQLPIRAESTTLCLQPVG